MKTIFQTNIGRKRNTNQDYVDIFYNESNNLLVILADGMGGHQAGDVASKIAVNVLGEFWQTHHIDDLEHIKAGIVQSIQQANQIIEQQGHLTPEYLGMGTTLVAAAVMDSAFVLANVGDSRAYLIREQQIIQLTEDHSLVNELVKSGEITDEMAANHPRKNVLTRSLGMPGEVEVDVTVHDWLSSDYLLLCSDGLTNMIDDEKILNILLSDQTLEQKVETLIAEANEAGGLDNITALVIDFNEQKEESQ